MKLTINKAITFLYLTIIIVFFFISFNEKKDDKIHLGGDNISYYLLGKSLSNGKGYTDNHLVGVRDGKITSEIAHTHYPPGYPAILAVSMYLFGDDISTSKNVNGFFLLLTALVMFFLLKELGLSQNLSFVASIFLLYNYHVLYFSMYMYSEISFMFFFTLFLYAYIKKGDTNNYLTNPYFYISIVSLGIMYYIKSITLGVVAGLILYLIIKRNWKEILIYSVTIIGVYLPWKMRLNGLNHSSYFTYLSYKNPYQKELGFMDTFDWFVRMWTNFKRYLSIEIPDGLIPMNPAFNYKESAPIYSWIIGIVIVGFLIYGITQLKKKSLFIFTVLSGVLGILLLWPEAWFGKRFFLPLIPIMYGLFFLGIYSLFAIVLKKVNAKTKKTVLNLFPFTLFFLLIPSFKSTEYLKNYANSDVHPKYANYFKAARWIKQNTPDSSVTVCRKPNLFHMYSGKLVTNYPKSISKEDVLNDFYDKKVDYIIVDALGFSSTGKYLVPTLQKYKGKFKQVFKVTNPDTYVFQFLPEMGYTGEWKDDKKNGKGTFKYADGSVYEGEWINDIRSGYGKYTWSNKMVYIGEWKNNKREGKGKLYLQNGNIISTTWVNDIMEGPAKIESKNNPTIVGKFVANKFIKQ